MFAVRLLADTCLCRLLLRAAESSPHQAKACPQPRLVSVWLFVFVLFLLSLGPAHGQSSTWSATGSARPVVFVCEHGSAKSAVAAAFFNQLAQARGLPVQAVFRGLTPDTALSAATRRGLQQDGLVVAGLRPQALTEQDVAGALEVVTLGCPLPPGMAAGKLQRWDGLASVNEEYVVARDQIKQRVAQLVEQLRHAPRD